MTGSLKEELATQMFGIQLILGASGVALELAYDILCKVRCRGLMVHTYFYPPFQEVGL